MLAAVAAAALAGCASSDTAPGAGDGSRTLDPKQLSASDGHTPIAPPIMPSTMPPGPRSAAVAPAGGEPSPQSAIIQLHMYQLLAPYGTTTHSAEFWKHLDEDCVDIATYDALQKNGLRVGRGKVSEWPYFKGILDQNSTVCQETLFACLSGQDLSLNVTPEMKEQTLFIFIIEPQLNTRPELCACQFL